MQLKNILYSDKVLFCRLSKSVILFIVLIASLGFTGCNDEELLTISDCTPYFHVRLLSQDGQNLLTVDPELPSIINDEFVITINDKPIELNRFWVRPLEDSLYMYDLDNDRFYNIYENAWTDPLTYGYSDYRCSSSHAQFCKLKGLSDKEVYIDGGHFFSNAVYYELAINFEKYAGKIYNDKIVDIKIEWPRGEKCWNFEYKREAHKSPKLYLDGKEQKKWPKKSVVVEIIIDNPALYNDRRFSDPTWPDE
ncbi:MAG: hypothetical protein K2M19_00110 [Muribaculaceae bacterium]|nr:hypothetical protein [Muribaculaceae bacterium]